MGSHFYPALPKFSFFCCCLCCLFFLNPILKPFLTTIIESIFKAHFISCDLETFAIPPYFDSSCHIVLSKLIETSIKVIWPFHLNLLVGMQSKGWELDSGARCFAFESWLDSYWFYVTFEKLFFCTSSVKYGGLTVLSLDVEIHPDCISTGFLYIIQPVSTWIIISFSLRVKYVWSTKCSDWPSKKLEPQIYYLNVTSMV